MKLLQSRRKFCVHHTTLHHITSCKATYVRRMGSFTCYCGNTGWNGYPNKSQYRKSTLEKTILPPLLQGFEPATFQSRVRRSNHWAIPAHVCHPSRGHPSWPSILQVRSTSEVLRPKTLLEEKRLYMIMIVMMMIIIINNVFLMCRIPQWYMRQALSTIHYTHTRQPIQFTSIK